MARGNSTSESDKKDYDKLLTHRRWHSGLLAIGAFYARKARSATRPAQTWPLHQDADRHHGHGRNEGHEHDEEDRDQVARHGSTPA
jgi:hypothetical protein